jgi:adenylate kinase family enzyme
MVTKRVSEDELRRMFNEGHYYERMKNGEFQEVIVSRNPRRRGDRRVRKTESQIVDYQDKYGNRVARVHQYRKPDGTLGGSGKPDPKSLFHEGVFYVIYEGEQWDLPRWYED